MLLVFLGLYDTTFIRAEGVRQRIDEAEYILEATEAIIARLAA
jgi:FMN-dependent NADH-azoreductase